jgi:hypothetical protein
VVGKQEAIRTRHGAGISSIGETSPFHSSTSGEGSECNGLWLLKKSIFLKTAEIWGIENV